MIASRAKNSKTYMLPRERELLFTPCHLAAVLKPDDTGSGVRWNHAVVRDDFKLAALQACPCRSHTNKASGCAPEPL